MFIHILRWNTLYTHSAGIPYTRTVLEHFIHIQVLELYLCAGTDTSTTMVPELRVTVLHLASDSGHDINIVYANAIIHHQLSALYGTT